MSQLVLLGAFALLDDRLCAEYEVVTKALLKEPENTFQLMELKKTGEKIIEQTLPMLEMAVKNETSKMIYLVEQTSISPHDINLNINTLRFLYKIPDVLVKHAWLVEKYSDKFRDLLNVSVIFYVWI